MNSPKPLALPFPPWFPKIKIFPSMAQGRGSAMFMTLLLCLLVFHCSFARAAVYTVGPRGWDFDSGSWLGGKRFKAGDVLVFKYNPAFHNVVAVPKSAYTGCVTPKGAKVYTTGNDRIKLVRGQNYFICNFPGHCESGMKIAVTAA